MGFCSLVNYTKKYENSQHKSTLLSLTRITDLRHRSLFLISFIRDLVYIRANIARERELQWLIYFHCKVSFSVLTAICKRPSTVLFQYVILNINSASFSYLAKMWITPKLHSQLPACCPKASRKLSSFSNSFHNAVYF